MNVCFAVQKMNVPMSQCIEWPPTRDPRTKQPNKVRLGLKLIFRARPHSFKQLQQTPPCPPPPTPLSTPRWDRSVTWDTSARHQPIRGSARIRTRRPRPFRENVMIVWKVHAVGRSASCKIKWTGKKSSIFVMYCTCIVFVKRKSTRFTGRRSCPMKNNEQNRKKLRKNKPGRTQEKQIRFYIKVFAYSMALSG